MDPSQSTPEAPDGSQPEKYIRTFAGDMETVQKGGVPDLTPFEEAPPKPETPSPPPPPTPEPQPEPETPKAPVISPEGPPPLKTYAGDFSERMKETHASTATILAAEGDTGTVTQIAAAPAPHSIKNIVFVVIGLTFLCLGGVGIYVAYLHYQSSQALVTPEPVVASPIFVDEREEIHDPLLPALIDSMGRSLPENKVRLLYEASSTESIFTKLSLGAPDLLTRNIKKEGSMAGIIHAGDEQSVFFILSVSYSPTFSGLLSWEKQMPQAFSALYPAYVAPVVPETATSTPLATTTPKTVATTTPTQPASVSFTDEVVNNHDVRMYRDGEGRSILLYGYWDPSTLIIARDPIAYSEILDRLSTTRTK